MTWETEMQKERLHVTKHVRKLFTWDTENGFCVHARLGSAHIADHLSHWLVAPKSVSRVKAHFEGLEVNNGTWVHPVLRGAFSWGRQSEEVSYILHSGVGTHQLCRPVLFMLTFEIYYAINVQLSLPSFLRRSLVLKPECKWGTFRPLFCNVWRVRLFWIKEYISQTYL